MRIEPFDPKTADDATAAAYVANVHACRATMIPPGEREPAEYTLNRMRNQSPKHEERCWAAFDGDELVASIEAFWFDAEDNRDRAWLHIDVVPSRYTEELAEALLRPALAELRGHGRTTLMVEMEQGQPFGKYVEARGGRVGSVDQCNMTRLAALDPADLATLARAPEGYELLAFDGPCPDELLDAYTRMNATMNTAPRDDLTMEDWVYTPQRIRDFETGHVARGHEWWTVCAREIGGTELAAFTTLILPPEWPEVAHQDDTAVAVPHRGHGLGYAVKATNLLRLVTERPQARWVVTWNAASNQHMLRVNYRLGFAAAGLFDTYEISADLLEAQPA